MTAKTPKQILTEALALFGPNGEHWTQGWVARNAQGRATFPDGQDATCWCPVGALIAVSSARTQTHQTAALYLHDALPEGLCTVGSYNDAPGRTFPEIRALFHAAIERAEACR